MYSVDMSKSFNLQAEDFWMFLHSQLSVMKVFCFRTAKEKVLRTKNAELSVVLEAMVKKICS